MMILRNYKTEDKNKCIEIFQSNYPKFFDKNELSLFINWLDHQVGNGPTYSDSDKDAYYVVELPETGIIGCGGFYIVKEKNEARLAWGMIHANFHKQGYGTALYNYRKEIIKRNGQIILWRLGQANILTHFMRKWE